MSGRGRTRYSNFSKRSYRCTPSMQKLPVGGLVFFWVQILDQLYPAHRVLKASVDCSEDLRDGGLGHKPATGSRSTLPRALLPSTARDSFLFVLRCEPGQPGTQQPPEPAALLAARRRVWRGAASGQPSRPWWARAGRSRAPVGDVAAPVGSSEVRRDSSKMASGHAPQRPLGDAKPTPRSLEPGGTGRGAGPRADASGCRPARTAGAPTAQVWAPQVWPRAGNVTQRGRACAGVRGGAWS